MTPFCYTSSPADQHRGLSPLPNFGVKTPTVASTLRGHPDLYKTVGEDPH
jgi:hypothetical protein